MSCPCVCQIVPKATKDSQRINVTFLDTISERDVLYTFLENSETMKFFEMCHTFLTSMFINEPQCTSVIFYGHSIFLEERGHLKSMPLAQGEEGAQKPDAKCDMCK